MVDFLIENDYEIKLVFIVLLKSEYFFDILSVGLMIKNLVDFIFLLLKQMQVSFLKDNFVVYYLIMIKFYSVIKLMEMDYINFFEVVGWKVYY